MGRRGYSAEFRRKVLDRLAEGHSVASVAHDLDLSDQPKRRCTAIEVMAAENLPVQVACRMVGVSGSGEDTHRNRTPAERSVGPAMLTDLIH